MWCQPGGKVSNQLYKVMDDLANEYGNGTLRLTTRQTFQVLPDSPSPSRALRGCWVIAAPRNDLSIYTLVNRVVES